MRNPSLFLIPLTLIVGYAVFQYGGVTTPEWSYCLVALCIVAMVVWLAGPSARLAPPPDRWISLLFAVLVVWVALQLVPLPMSWLKVLSPARAELLGAVMQIDPGQTRAPISVAPSVTFAHLLRLLAYILVFFLVREAGWRLKESLWRLAIPVICIAAFEAGLGLAQYFGGAAQATGTYVNHNHYAGLLEVALPLAGMLTAVILRRQHLERTDSIPWALLACLLIACSALIFLGLIYSFSRMGLLVAIASIAILAVLSAAGGHTGKNRALAAGGMLAIMLTFVVLAIPNGLLDRFAQTPAGEDLTSDARLQIWKETQHLIGAYPIFGCGLGTYASAIQKYRASSPLSLVDFAHNDYLQLLAELGPIGFVPLFACGLLNFGRLFRRALTEVRTRRRFLAAGCATSLFAIAMHSLVDFNLYIPANAMLVAWVAGIGTAMEFPTDEKHRGRRHSTVRQGGESTPSSE